MRHAYRDDRKLCRAPLLGNGDLLFPMDAEGGITPSLPTPLGLPSSALYRIGRVGEDGRPQAYLHLIPSLFFLGRPLGSPWSVATEFSTDEATFSSVCKYDRGVTVETRACAFFGRPLLIVTKKISCPGSLTVAYTLAPAAGSLQLKTAGDMLTAERTLPSGREKLCLFASLPAKAEVCREGGRLAVTVGKTATITFYLYFSETDDPTGSALWPELSEMQSYIRRTGEGRLFHEHIASWRAYSEESELSPQDEALARVADGSRYLLRVFSGRYGSPLRGDHPYAPFGHAPSVDLRVLSALLHTGHLGEAKRILDALRRELPTAERRFSGEGTPGARYPYYADCMGRECLPDDARRDRVIQSADVAVAFHKYYCFTEDRRFLAEEAMPVLRSVAAFLMARAVRVTDGEVAVHAPDPEVEGVAVRRPLLTSVAVAAALHAFCEAAKLLSTDRLLVARAERAAADILRSLPLSRGSYTAAERVDMPGRAPLFLSPYRVSLREEPKRRATVYAGLTASRLSPPPYDLALLSVAYANQHTSALGGLVTLSRMADEFGFLPPFGAEGAAEMPALFLDGLCRALVCYDSERLYIGFGLDPDETKDVDFMFPLPFGALVDGRVRDGRFASLRVHRGHKRSGPGSIEIVMPKWLYTDGAAVAVRKRESGGIMYMTTVVH